MERIGYSLATIIEEVTGKNRIPMSLSIQSYNFILAAAENFDKNDGTEGSHDTILMFFQNGRFKARFKDNRKKCMLTTILECQNLIPSNRSMKTRGHIQRQFNIGSKLALADSCTLAGYLQFLKQARKMGIPSLSVVSSILS